MSVSDFHLKKIKDISSSFLYRVAVNQETGDYNFDELFFHMKNLCENIRLFMKEMNKGNMPDDWKEYFG